MNSAQRKSWADAERSHRRSEGTEDGAKVAIFRNFCDQTRRSGSTPMLELRSYDRIFAFIIVLIALNLPLLSSFVLIKDRLARS